MKTPKDFKVGEIYKMNVAERSTVTNPYYVYIKEIGDDYIITSIPGQHDLKIRIGSDYFGNWDYHIPRMVKYSHINTKYKHVLYNQKLD